jgi:hypothetical protein
MPDLKLVQAAIPDLIDRATERAIAQLRQDAARLKEEAAVVRATLETIDAAHGLAGYGPLVDRADAAAVIEFHLWQGVHQIQLSMSGAGGYAQLQEPIEEGRYRALILLYRTGDR